MQISAFGAFVFFVCALNAIYTLYAIRPVRYIRTVRYIRPARNIRLVRYIRTVRYIRPARNIVECPYSAAHTFLSLAEAGHSTPAALRRRAPGSLAMCFVGAPLDDFRSFGGISLLKNGTLKQVFR